MLSNTLTVTLKLLLFENYSHFSSTLSSKNNTAYFNVEAKVCLYSRDHTINHDEKENENEKMITTDTKFSSNTL